MDGMDFLEVPTKAVTCLPRECKSSFASYRLEVFSWLARKDRFLLLSGPSVERVKSVLEEHWSARPALVGINHIFNIERNLLEPLGLTFDIWVIFSADDAERYADRILEFLARRTSVALLTSAFALDRISDILELRDVPNPHKIILCDAAIEKIQRITSPIPSSPFNYQTMRQ